jgi:hypothetical protein
LVNIVERLGAVEISFDDADLARCHELHGDRSGQLSLDLDHPYRLLFRPAGDPEPGPGGGLDWAAVRAVVVIGIEDTHR